jgi:hypothetical protein
MSVQVTIEAASKAEAELIAAELPGTAEARSWRGLGVIRLGRRSKEETKELIEAVARSFEQHGLQWARVRYDDEERVFRPKNSRRSDRAHIEQSVDRQRLGFGEAGAAIGFDLVERLAFEKGLSKRIEPRPFGAE